MTNVRPIASGNIALKVKSMHNPHTGEREDFTYSHLERNELGDVLKMYKDNKGRTLSLPSIEKYHRARVRAYH